MVVSSLGPASLGYGGAEMGVYALCASVADANEMCIILLWMDEKTKNNLFMRCTRMDVGQSANKVSPSKHSCIPATIERLKNQTQTCCIEQ